MMIMIVTAAAVFILDQGTKYFFGLTDGVLIPGVAQISFVANRGISLGLLTGSDSWVLTLIGAAALAAAVFFLIRHAGGKWQRVCLGMVIGGGVGNLLDRLRLGYVTDFIDLLFMRFYVFNVADAMIVVGMILLGISLLMEERRG